MLHVQTENPISRGYLPEQTRGGVYKDSPVENASVVFFCEKETYRFSPFITTLESSPKRIDLNLLFGPLRLRRAYFFSLELPFDDWN